VSIDDLQEVVNRLFKEPIIGVSEANSSVSETIRKPPLVKAQTGFFEKPTYDFL